MRKSRFTGEKVIGVLREAEMAPEAGEVARRHGISRETLHRWKRKCEGMEVSDAKRLGALQEENGRLKRVVAHQALDIQVLKDVLEKSGDDGAAADDRP